MALTDEGSASIPATMLVAPTGIGNAAAMPYPYPVYGYGGQQNGNNNGFGGDWAWIILLLLLANGGWGGMGGMGGGMMWPMMMGAGMGGFGLGYDFPWLLNGQQGINNNVSDGFRDAQLHDSVTSVRDGVSNLATQLCDCCGNIQMGIANTGAALTNAVNSGFGDVQLGIAGLNQNVSTTGAGIQQSLCNGFSGVNLGMAQGFAGVNSAIANTAAQGEIAANGRHSALTGQLYNNEIANLNRSFSEQAANTQGFNALQGQLANCCCENRAGIADLKYVVATENCADRTAAAQNTRDIIDSQTRGTQAILDKLCALELDGVKGQLAAAQRENVALQNAVNMASFRESQANQNALFAQGLNNEVDALYDRLKNCPVNTVPVYGNQPIFTCPNNGWNNGCGCGQ